MGRKAFFLDRDGVINGAIGKRPPNNSDEFELLPGVREAIKSLNDMGFLVFVVTNQGGVGLGYMSEEDLSAIHGKLIDKLAEVDAHVDEIAACTHKPWIGCDCRKPKPGMILRLAKKYNVDLAASYMVGDRSMDIMAGKAAGTKTIFVGTTEDAPEEADYISESLISAVKLLFSDN